MKCVLALALAALSCRLPSPVEDPELVRSLRFSPSAFDSFKRNTELRYTLKYPVRLSLLIVYRDSTGAESLVRTLGLDIAETAGAHAHTWIGDTMYGAFAPAGHYLGLLRVGGESFETDVLIYH